MAINWWNLLKYQVTPYFGALWFLSTAIVALIVLLLLCKFLDSKSVIVITMIVAISLYFYAVHLQNTTISNIPLNIPFSDVKFTDKYFKNGWLYAFPMIYTGYFTGFLVKNLKILKSKKAYHYIVCSCSFILIAFTIMFYKNYRNTLSSINFGLYQLYFELPFIVMCILIICSTIPNAGSKTFSTLAHIGQKYTVYIYIFHGTIAILLNTYIVMPANWFTALLIFIGTITGCIIGGWIVELIKTNCKLILNLLIEKNATRNLP